MRFGGRVCGNACRCGGPVFWSGRRLSERADRSHSRRLRRLRNGEDPIHDTRVAIRRRRSTLRVFAKVLDGTGHLDDDLKWFAGVLGEVRDCQVQRRRFTAAIDDLPRELVLGPVKSRIRHDLRAVELPARRRVSEEMESDRYQALMAVLQEWRIRPPVVRGVSRKALCKQAPQAARKADRRLAAALDDDSAAMLHRARKASKRARYAAELRKPLDRAAKRTVKQYKQIQNFCICTPWHDIVWNVISPVISLRRSSDRCAARGSHRRGD